VLESNDAWNTVGPTYAGTCAGTTGTAGNVSVDPMFVDAAHDDYHLRADSVLIDAGTNTGAPADDRDGDARPFDGDEDGTATTDIGFDEAVDPVLVAPVSLYVGNVDVTASGLGSVTIGNFGSAPMTVDSLSVAGPNATEYSVHQEDCTQVPIAIGDTCTVSIAFAPIDLGTRTASLTISGPDPSGSTRSSSCHRPSTSGTPSSRSRRRRRPSRSTTTEAPRPR
jgi:hypothetical protein